MSEWIVEIGDGNPHIKRMHELVRCKDCKRNADNGGLYPNGRTQCPIQEHYALLQDGYCHLGERREVQRNFNASNTLDALETEVTE